MRIGFWLAVVLAVFLGRMHRSEAMLELTNSTTAAVEGASWCAENVALCASLCGLGALTAGVLVGGGVVIGGIGCLTTGICLLKNDCCCLSLMDFPGLTNMLEVRFRKCCCPSWLDASWQGNLLAVRLALLGEDPFFWKTDDEGNTLLIRVLKGWRASPSRFCKKKKYLGVVKFLCKRYSDIRSYFDHQNGDGQSALNIAVENNFVEAVSALIRAGAHIDSADADTAVTKGFWRVARRLFEKSATPSDALLAKLVKAHNVCAIKYLLTREWPGKWQQVNDALAIAIDEKLFTIAELLIAKGGSVADWVDRAVEKGAFSIADMLIEKGEKPSVGLLERMVQDEKYSDAVGYLAKRCPWLLTQKDLGEKTVLHQAALSAGPRTVGILVANDVDVNAVDSRGNTALMYAAEKGRLDIAQYLVQHGALVGVINKRGNSAVGEAAKSKNLSLVKYLMSKGAPPPNISEENYATPSIRAYLRLLNDAKQVDCKEKAIGALLKARANEQSDEGGIFDRILDPTIIKWLPMAREVRDIANGKTGLADFFRRHNLSEGALNGLCFFAIALGSFRLLEQLYAYDAEIFKLGMRDMLKIVKNETVMDLDAAPADGIHWHLQCLLIAITCGSTSLFKNILRQPFGAPADLWNIAQGVLLARKVINRPSDERLAKGIKNLKKSWLAAGNSPFKWRAKRFMETKISLDQQPRIPKELTSKILGYLSFLDS
ncbi:MAG: ankyrin repeat domain-containing protein [Candidatus Dependentiae bacterium]|nr:ankyrin repeat domain-containing protein [Candidatus Dependentiae bacterium]